MANTKKYHSEIAINTVQEESKRESKQQETLSQMLSRILDSLSTTESFVNEVRSNLYVEGETAKCLESVVDGSLETKIRATVERITDINCVLKLIVSRL